MRDIALSGVLVMSSLIVYEGYSLVGVLIDFSRVSYRWQRIRLSVLERYFLNTILLKHLIIATQKTEKSIMI